jgi:putative transposase
VRTVRNECLYWLLIIGRRHLEHSLRGFVEHYNTQRPHRGLQLRTPVPVARPALASADQTERADLLGGLIHEYSAIAA